MNKYIVTESQSNQINSVPQFSSSKKVYITGTRDDIRVPMRNLII